MSKKIKTQPKENPCNPWENMEKWGGNSWFDKTKTVVKIEDKNV